MAQNLAKIKWLSQKIFRTLMPNVIEGPYISWLKFHPFCMDGNDQNEAKGQLGKMTWLLLIKKK
jgi:hypothetical protein